MTNEALCELALDQHADRLGDLPNVVGLGVVSQQEDKPASSELAVGIYVSKKLPPNKLMRSERIPKYLTVRYKHRNRRVPTRVIDQGEVALENFKESL